MLVKSKQLIFSMTFYCARQRNQAFDAFAICVVFVLDRGSVFINAKLNVFVRMSNRLMNFRIRESTGAAYTQTKRVHVMIHDVRRLQVRERGFDQLPGALVGYCMQFRRCALEGAANVAACAQKNARHHGNPADWPPRAFTQ